MEVGAVKFLSSGKGKGSSGPRDGVFFCSADEHIFSETAMHAKALASNRLRRANSVASRLIRRARITTARSLIASPNMAIAVVR